MQALLEPNRKKFMMMLLLTAISNQLINLAMPAFRNSGDRYRFPEGLGNDEN